MRAHHGRVIGLGVGIDQPGRCTGAWTGCWGRRGGRVRCFHRDFRLAYEHSVQFRAGGYESCCYFLHTLFVGLGLRLRTSFFAVLLLSHCLFYLAS